MQGFESANMKKFQFHFHHNCKMFLGSVHFITFPSTSVFLTFNLSYILLSVFIFGFVNNAYQMT